MSKEIVVAYTTPASHLGEERKLQNVCQMTRTRCPNT